MASLKIDYALLASVVAGIFLLIPFLGPVVAVWVPVTIALFTRPDAALVLFIALLALQQVIFHVVAPRIMHQEVGLHPLLVFFAVLTGARVAGIWGAIFGVPVVAVLATMASFYRATQQERVARLQQQLPGKDLVSVRRSSPPSPTPVPSETPISR
jgi:predicted PurR-regulated permease PerM